MTTGRATAWRPCRHPWTARPPSRARITRLRLESDGMGSEGMGIEKHAIRIQPGTQPVLIRAERTGVPTRSGR
jgi:hypothetical protein